MKFLRTKFQFIATAFALCKSLFSNSRVISLPANSSNGILVFDMNDRDSFEIACNGWKYLAILQDFDSELRAKIKHDDTLSEEQCAAYEVIRSRLWEYANDRDIDLWSC